MVLSNLVPWFTQFLLKYVCINDPSNISAGAQLAQTQHATEYPPAETGQYSPIFEAYVHRDKSSFQNLFKMSEGLWLIKKKGNLFFFHLVVPENNIQKKTSCSKQGKYVRISGAVRGHYLFQDANNSRERSSRKTVSRSAKLIKGYCINIYKYTFVKAKLEIFVLKSVPFGTTSDTVVFWIYFHKKAS